MTTVFAAFYGEYEEPHPIGVFQSLAAAKKAVVDSSPRYNTEVVEYDLRTGNVVMKYFFNVQKKSWTS